MDRAHGALIPCDGAREALTTLLSGEAPHASVAQLPTWQACSRHWGCSVDRWTRSLPCGAQRSRTPGQVRQDRQGRLRVTGQGPLPAGQAAPSCGQSLGWAGTVSSLQRWLP